MNREVISHAMDNIDTAYIQEAYEYDGDKKRNRRIFSWKRTVGLVAALVVCFTLALPALAAADVGPAYDLLYAISPEMAQKLKPVRLSDTDNDIKMEVISAYIRDDNAEVLVSLQDTAAERIDETTDLFDSYSINRPFSCSATCNMVNYDPETHTATFLISITQWGEREIDGEKLTFSIDKFLSDKQEYRDTLPDIDLSNASVAPQIQTQSDLRGTSWNGGENPFGNEVDCLIPSADNTVSPVDGVTITAIGFVDGELHVQVHYDDILNTDNNGDVWLEDADGTVHGCYGAVHFWDNNRVGSYSEYIFDISPDQISNYELAGYFKTCSTVTTGDWQVTFSLEYEE